MLVKVNHLWVKKPGDGLSPSGDLPGGGEDYGEVKKDDKGTEVSETGNTTECQ